MAWRTSHKLAVTEHTIRNYLSAINEKLGVSTRVELALYAVVVLRTVEAGMTPAQSEDALQFGVIRQIY
jgi:Bacterial regulatory proteins, luxR family